MLNSCEKKYTTEIEEALSSVKATFILEGDDTVYSSLQDAVESAEKMETPVEVSEYINNEYENYQVLDRNAMSGDIVYSTYAVIAIGGDGENEVLADVDTETEAEAIGKKLQNMGLTIGISKNIQTLFESFDSGETEILD